MRPALVPLAPVLLLLAGAAAGQEPCAARGSPLREPVALGFEAPQGIARDASGHYWITSALSHDLLELDADLEPVGRITAAVPRVENPFGNHFAGIAHNPLADTLFVCRSFTKEIWEVRKDGSLTGFVLPLNLPRPPNVIPEPFPKGIAFDPAGDGGAGSFWVVEGVLTAIYEVSLDGRILQTFCHPDDLDGCPGRGRAAHSNDIGLFREDGELFLELVGGTASRERVLRVDIDGVPTGLSYPLAEVGGAPGGFLRDRMRSPETGEQVDVLLVTVESSAELHVLEITDPGLLPLLDLECESTDGGVAIRWRGTDSYEAIEVWRDGGQVDSLPGSALSYEDGSPPDGILDYEIVARRGECAARVGCTIVVGAGRVIRSVFLDDRQIVDVTEDAEENLWVTHAAGEIGVYSKDLELLFFFNGPFTADGDITSGIAFNPRSPAGNPTLFVYNAATNMVVEIDGTGMPIDAPFASGVPPSGDEPALVPSMLHDPDGDGGSGSFWYVDYVSGTIQERSRAGELIHSCVHPDHAAEPPPPGFPRKAYAWGVGVVPGEGFGVLELSGGRVRDGRTTRLFRMETPTCEPIGVETPVDGIAQLAAPVVLNFLRTTHEGNPVLYVVNSNTAPRTWFLEVDARRPAVPAVAGLSCAQEGEEPDVTLGFSVDGAADAVEIRRDGELLVELPGDATGHVDRDVAPGLHEYSVRCRLGAATGDDRTCSARVGPGVVASRSFLHPVSLVHQVAFDPVENVYVAASTDNRISDSLHIFEADFSYGGPIDSPFPFPWQVAALAVRDAGGASERLCLGWRPGSPPGAADEDTSLPVRVTDAEGTVLREFSVRMPRPRGSLVVFPSGMAWDGATDTVWILERNSGTIINADLGGHVRARVAHPRPIHQDGVVNYGLAIDSSRGVLYAVSAGRLERRISTVVEFTPSGRLTGFEVPLDVAFYNRIRGFALDASGRNLVVSAAATSAAVSDFAVHRAFGDVEPVRDLACRHVGDGGDPAFELTWTNGGVYDAVAVFRGAEPAAELEGTAVSWLDGDVPTACELVYRVVPRQGRRDGPGAVCEPLSPASFIRGDVEENGKITITDGIALLEFLFRGGREPSCRDAADADDSGRLEITDAVLVVHFLFLGGRPPAPPFPRHGCDPTPDALGCRG